jgi:tetratricopeptide (TPR) repeat protein
MRSCSCLRWFFLALLYPLSSYAFIQQPFVQPPILQKDMPAFRFAEPDAPRVTIPLPSAQPALVISPATPPVRLASPSVAAALRFTLDPKWVISDIPFGEVNAPVSANVLRALGKPQRELERALKAAGKKDWATAEKHLQAALQLYPEFAAAYHNLGVIALIQGKLRDGEAFIERSLLFDDKSLYSLFALAQVRLWQGDMVAAHRYVDRFLTVSPGEPHGLALRAVIFVRENRLDDALHTYARLEQTDHRAVSEFHLLAGSLHELKQSPELAIAEYKKYLRERPGSKDKATVATVIAELQTFLAKK